MCDASIPVRITLFTNIMPLLDVSINAVTIDLPLKTLHKLSANIVFV